MTQQGPNIASSKQQYDQEGGTLSGSIMPPPVRPNPNMGMIPQQSINPTTAFASGNYNYGTPIKRSMTFLTAQELFSYKMVPAVGVTAYLASSVGAVARDEIFKQWCGSDYSATMLHKGLVLTSVGGIACYMYGRRHIRHAGAFQKMIYPVFGSAFFNAASHLFWKHAINGMFAEQDSLDHHWRVVAGVISGFLFLYTGSSYLYFIDHW